MPNPFAPYVPQSQASMIKVKPISSSPSLAPIFTTHREVAVVDSAEVTSRALGMNMTGYEKGIVRVIPGDNTNVDIEVLFWSETDSKFISANPKEEASGLGNGVSYDYTLDVLDRIIFVYVTGTIGGSEKVDVFIAGSELDRDR